MVSGGSKNGSGYIDTKGNMVLEPQFSYACQFADGMARVVVGKKWGIIDKTGKFLVEAKYQDLCEFKEGLARVQIGGKYGYIDQIGQAVIEPVYKDASVSFIDGYAHVELGKEGFFIDKQGKRYDQNPWPVGDASKEDKDLIPKYLGPRYWEK